MITETVVGWATEAWAWFLGLFDAIKIPDMLSKPPDGLALLIDRLDGFGIWIPWSTFKTVFLLVSGFILSCFLARAIRVAIGHIPAIGGNG